MEGIKDQTVTSMSRRKVHAIFDNGNVRQRPSFILVAEDATLGDAVHAFNQHHARNVWEVEKVKLMDIVRSEEKFNRHEELPCLSTSIPLSEMVDANDFLVFCATDPHPRGNVIILEDDEDTETEEDKEETDKEIATKKSPASRSLHGSRLGSNNEQRNLADHSFPPVHRRTRRKTRQFDLQADKAASKWHSDTWERWT